MSGAQSLPNSPPAIPTEAYQAIWSAMSWLDGNDQSVTVGAEREVDAKARLDLEKELLASSESSLSDDALAQDGLTNDVLRKRAITKALKESPDHQQLTASVRDAQTALRKAEVDHQAAKDRRTSNARKLDAAGKIADLMGEHACLQSSRILRESAQINLQSACLHKEAIQLNLQAQSKGN